MAKWRLTAAHYLNVPGTEWEYKETDRTSGRQARKVFEVPMLLDPKDPTVCNRDGDCIVVQGVEPGRGEHLFVGEPTPDMEPLDDEASAISAKFQSKWRNPIDSLPSNGEDYGSALVKAFERQISELIKSGAAAPAQPVSAGSVSVEEFKQLQEQVAALMAQNAELKKHAVVRRA